MRIALDARTVYRAQRRGTGKNLIDLYRHALAERPDWRVTAFHREETLPADHFTCDGVTPRRIETRGDRFHLWERWRLPLAACLDRVDVLHCPANTSPAWMPVPTVVTIHDLIPLDAGDITGDAFAATADPRRAADADRFEDCIRQASERAAWIITPSTYTRNRLVNEFGADAARITVNPWAPDSAVRCVPPEQCRPVLDKYNVSAPYILHLGAAAPRKNTRRMLEAWAMVERPVRKRWTLLVVGLDDATRASLTTLVDRLGLRGSVRLCGFADENDLPALLSASVALAYPSLSEGFGLPLLDAWVAQTPVLTSNTTSLPEVAGDAALLVDPADPCAIARGLARLMTDAALRATLVGRGLERVQRYTWQATARRFVQTMERATGRLRLEQPATITSDVNPPIRAAA